MQSASKFLFDNCFDLDNEPELDEDEMEAAAPPPPTFSEEEISRARAQGFVEGRAEGIAEMQAAIDQRMSDLMSQMLDRIRELGEVHEAAHCETHRQMVALGAAIARKILPEIAVPHALSAIEEIVRESLPKLLDEPRVVLRVHATALEEMRARIDEIAAGSGFPGDIILIADDALGQGDCRVEWADGGADRSEERIWAAIDAAVETHLASRPPAEPPSESDATSRTEKPAPVTGEPDTHEENTNGR